ncbi:MAG: hypothetical protein UV07_C0007G0036 [Candidatus Azambacteria bacterium GW2011_GWB1_42_17]|uniref:Uncharacterized protein n=2 Tax=Candidatus Azamiibacteriota TaxID=1752741 RepID=A0A0G0ZB37_9BACT|nr:MAG: hypothetical protein UV07_C0007G0036 [Candidatus Azambacteria bacterium GW2011_GWB1_42_17]KKS45935.1 MAG: hypothetical protein UV10_C0011G0021 [Candidatus Azambacteria bacterium GW2011_GWA1_42_19]KKS88656.1 MAG: hypothetical protein UV62_C0004G0045 [Parcubacteria group bacterium GW2011_GWC1_43_11]
MKMKKLLLIITFIVIVVPLAFFVLFFIQDQRDKASLMKVFKDLPVFSENNACMDFGFRPRDRVMGTWASVGCKYVPLYGFNTTIEKYDAYLKNSGWILYSKAQNEENFYYEKNNYRFSISIPSRKRFVTIDNNDEIIARTDEARKTNPYITIGIELKK